MSTFAPTTVFQLQKPTVGQDEYGDPENSYATETPDVPATIAERRRRFWDPTSGREETITHHEALIPGHVHVRAGYRVLEPSTGRTLHVVHVHRPQNIVFPGAVARLELEVIGAS